jgi:predicted aspartyl protease
MIRPMQRALLLAVLVAMLAITASPPSAVAQFYRWVDEQGNVHYAEGIDNVPQRYRDGAVPLGMRNTPPASAAPDIGGSSATETLIRFVPGRHIVVDARINGTATVKLILDTGAAGTLISPRALIAAGVSLTRGTRAARTRGIAKGAEVEVMQVPIQSLEVGGARVGRMIVASYDMDMPDAEGLLGQDFLGQFNVVIDSANGTVKLTKR